MKPRRPFIPQRKPIFVGCEGYSESAYIALVQDFARDFDLPIHLRISVLAPGAGDPLARITKATQEIKKLRENRTKPELSFVFLDKDQADQHKDRALQAIRLAAANNILLVWQKPCFEAFLLRHFPGQQQRQLASSQDSMEAIRRLWPDYRKGCSRETLRKQIDWTSIQRAASVETELAAFLRALNFPL